MIVNGALEMRKFGEEGSKKYVELLRTRPLDLFEKLETLVADPSLSEDLGMSLIWHPVRTRLDLAKTLWELFGFEKPLEREAGNRLVWNWLSAALFQTLVGSDMNYVQKKRDEEIERWVLTESSRSYHRHLVSGPFFVFRNNWPDTDHALCQLAESNSPIKGVPPVLIFGEVAERISGKRELSYGSLTHLATLLYVDPKTKKIRDGLTDKPGEAQQLSKYFKQLDLTVDYESMSVRDLLDLLPKNFNYLVSKVRKENRHLR
ncbi:MAG TPA: hypothetical protein VMW30_06830 [Candidatus Paceibacterota bacterium]|nr:hypothetical protein [Candidatus Paceibacterota bacterium]